MVRHLRWALLWAALIFVLCLMPGQAIPSWDWADLLNVDKLVHAALFAVLFLLLERGLRRFHAVEGKPAKVVLTAIVASVAYGGLMELMQQLPALGRALRAGTGRSRCCGRAAAGERQRYRASDLHQWHHRPAKGCGENAAR